MNTNKPIVLLTFTSEGAEILCSRQLQLYRAFHTEPGAQLEGTRIIQGLTIATDYKKDPEGYSCFGSYYVIEHAKISKGLCLETSAGVYQWA